jgi:hypothetical protein
MHAAWQYGMTLMCSAQPVCNSMQLSAACSATHVRAMFVNMRADAHACNSMQTYSEVHVHAAVSAHPQLPAARLHAAYVV